MTIVCNTFDKRIKDFSDILSFKKYDDKYIGKTGYFSDSMCRFQDLKDCARETLVSIAKDAEAGDYIFESQYGNYRFFLPESVLKPVEKKYRPYTIKDFEKAFLNDEFEDFIIFRDKHNPDDIYTMRYNGNFRKGQFEYICLGAKNFSFESLFENYEVADYDGDWQPFGVIDEEGVGE